MGALAPRPTSSRRKIGSTCGRPEPRRPPINLDAGGAWASADRAPGNAEDAPWSSVKCNLISGEVIPPDIEALAEPGAARSGDSSSRPTSTSSLLEVRASLSLIHTRKPRRNLPFDHFGWPSVVGGAEPEWYQGAVELEAEERIIAAHQHAVMLEIVRADSASIQEGHADTASLRER